ncbi:DUF3857 domain-containing transglutaminase family protein [Dyadobacter psychrotolerans]|uniref:DUF3857 domain-containing protein n=1 Tax=Dyadobacter psychrotolerans TaxID=2541721 RepID=A0A4R5DDZ3_9BACT|nr:DUF3857 domain-containing protein [Dyadobacter psychrotolerans]TDE12056.1 DUF3857 domain-containing protein [Dyadobacter psychrotolerans]
MKTFTFKNLFLLVCCLFSFPVFSQEDFSVSKINSTLLTEANAVIRLDESYWEIISKGEAKQHNRLVVTILNEKGEERHSQLMVRYDKFTKITDISGNLYDATGKVIKRLKNADIEDYGYGAGGDDITDARVKTADFGRKSYAYPYTIEYSYDIRDRNMMFYPRWMVAQNSESSVEHCTYMVKMPAGFQFRYKGYNEAPAVVKSKDADGSDLYIWKIDNRPAVKTTDSYPLPLIESAMMILTAPSDFEIQDYQGSFTSWEDLSKFYYTLNAGRDLLPAATQAEIQELVKNAKSDREKILLVYKWMQGRSRYVSIQLGIGGWQTIDAATVANKGYGDCKALTNFTLAALRQVGIPCYAALIKAGEEVKIKPDFPSSQFNHVIACAIAEKDTIWLECTSQTTPANFMGTFTGGRPALLVMPKGGKLITTPDYRSHHNLRKSRADVKLEATGDGKIQVHTLYTGLQQESRTSILHNSSGEAQKKWIISHINLPSLDLERFELTEGKDEEPSVTEKLNLNVRNCATKTGTRLFVKTSLLSRPFEMPAITERNTDFYLPPSEYDFTDLDTIAYTIPPGYKPESLLPAVQVKSIFGSFETKTAFTGDQLLCSRKVVLNGGRYPAKDYTAWIEFLKKVRKADRAQVVFVANKE